MDYNSLENFYDELEDIATNYNQDWNVDGFSNKVDDIKKLYKEANINIPEEFKMVKRPLDFRTKMQKYSKYKERRERLNEIIYPLFDFLNNTNDESYGMSQKAFNNYLKNNNKTIKTTFGNITEISLNSKNGGNGAVYFGKLYDKEVAIKVLFNIEKDKRNRFLCEFLNLKIGINNYDGIVNQYFYEEIRIDNMIVPIIVMKKYKKNLGYVEEVSQDYLISCFNQLIKSIKKIHNSGIIHRDLKPQNILIDENGRLNIADFGIAHFNKDFYALTGHTTSTDRLANYSFSAPEQINGNNELTPAADIYAIGEVMQWLVYNETCRGLKRKKITEKYPGKRMELLDIIIDKCLCNDPKDRYQSIEEIEEYISSIRNNELIEQKRKVEVKDLKAELEELIKNITKHRYISGTGELVEVENFQLMTPTNFKTVEKFLNNIPQNIKKMVFYENVNFSDFYENVYYDYYEIKKELFLNLYELYSKIKNNKELYDAFITYIVKNINKNVVSLPF